MDNIPPKFFLSDLPIKPNNLECLITLSWKGSARDKHCSLLGPLCTFWVINPICRGKLMNLLTFTNIFGAKARAAFALIFLPLVTATKFGKNCTKICHSQKGCSLKYVAFLAEMLVKQNSNFCAIYFMLVNCALQKLVGKVY